MRIVMLKTMKLKHVILNLFQDDRILIKL